MALPSPLKPLSSADLLQVLSQIAEIPTLPTVMAKIMGLTARAETGADELLAVLKYDPALSAKVLKIANSAFYAQIMPVGSVQRAIMVIGFNEIRNVALSSVVIRSFPENAKLATFRLPELWKHSLAVAFGAKLLAERTKACQPDDAFMAGLLHDIGKVIISQHLPKYFQVVYHYVANTNLTMVACEREILGDTHARVGEWLCRQWKLPEAIRVGVARHHESDYEGALLSDENGALVNILRLANALAKLLKIGSGGDKPTTVRIPPELLEQFGLGVEGLKELTGKIAASRTAIDGFFS